MLENEKQSSGTVTPDEKKPEVWIVKVYNTFSGRVEPVEVSKAVYDEYRRGEWRTEKRDGKEEFNTECVCSAYKIYEEAVHEAFSILTYKLKANSELLIGRLIRQLEQLQKRCGTSGDRIEEIDKEIAQLSAQNHVLAKLNNNGILGAAEYSEQSSTIENKIYSLRIERRKKLSESQEDEMLDELKTLKNC